MSFDASFALFACFVALALTTDATIGFGSMLVAVTLGAHLYPISTLLPILVCLSISLSSYIVVANRRLVNWPLLLRRVLPAMLTGMVLGYTLFGGADDQVLRIFLGIFVTTVATHDLYRFLRNKGVTGAPMSPTQFALTSGAAGIVHGITVTGGPILVYGLGRLGMGKGVFRATLAFVWVILNSVWVLVFLQSGRLDSHNLPFVAALIPVLVCSIGLGNYLHGRLDERMFRIAILVMLLFAGLALLA